MLSLILKSICAGIATLVAAVFLGVFVALPLTTMALANINGSHGSAEFGWDITSLAHSYQAIIILSLLIVFAVGFLFGYRYFSRSLVKN
jgi:uncharacterized protein YneF (UPF0154 family)